VIIVNELLIEKNAEKYRELIEVYWIVVRIWGSWEV
jgi:hypothetical protein